MGYVDRLNGAHPGDVALHDVHVHLRPGSNRCLDGNEPVQPARRWGTALAQRSAFRRRHDQEAPWLLAGGDVLDHLQPRRVTEIHRTAGLRLHRRLNLGIWTTLVLTVRRRR